VSVVDVAGRERSQARRGSQIRRVVRREAGHPGNWVLVVVMLAAACVGAQTPRFFSVDNGKAILVSTGTIGIAALGVTAIMICGGLVSLAVGQTAAVAGMVFLFALDLGLVPALVAGMAVAGIATALQGAMVGAWQANPIVLTIAAASILTAVGARLTSRSAVHPASDAYEALNRTPGGVPVVVLALLGLTAAVQLVLTTTRIGRYMYAVGENRAAARAAGLPIAVTTIGAFALAGALMALSGAFSASTSHTITLLGASQLTFNATAAVLAGGTAIFGGSGSAVRTLFGAVLIATVTDLLLLRGADIGMQTLVKGLLVLLVVLLGHLRATRGRA